MNRLRIFASVLLLSLPLAAADATPKGVPGFDMSVSVTAAPDPVDAGGLLVFVVTYANGGPGTAVYTASLPLPAPTTLDSFTQTSGPPCVLATPAGAPVTASCNQPAGTLVVLRLSLRVPPATANDTVLTLAETLSLVGDTDDGNDTASASATVRNRADLAITKDDGRATLVAGGTTVYVLTATNAGPLAVSGATLSDPVPAGLADVAWACVPAQSTAPCPVPATGVGALQATVSLGVGHALRFDYSARVVAGAAAAVDNVASIAAPAGVLDPVVGNNAASDNATVLASRVFANGFE